LVIVCEGCWGALLTLLVIYPVAYMIPGKDHGSFEDPFDAMALVYNSRVLQVMTIAFVLSVTAYNCLAVYLTKYLSAIWHAILDAFRPVTIWALGLIIHYFIAQGEKNIIVLSFCLMLFSFISFTLFFRLW
jgi:hypothetical protein